MAEKNALSHFLFALLCFFLCLKSNEGFTQTFQLRDHAYRKVNSKWHLFLNDRKANEIILNRLIVRLRDRSDVRNFEFDQIGLSDIKVLPTKMAGGYFVLGIDATQDPFYIASTISNQALFDYVAFDYLIEPCVVPNDDDYQAKQWNLPKIGMPNSWNLTKGDHSIVVAVVDDGGRSPRPGHAHRTAAAYQPVAIPESRHSKIGE